MADEDVVREKGVPKGKVRGGTRFPKQSLRDAVEWSNKLVSKTHNGPQPSDVVLTGAFGSKSTTSEVKASTLRQFGLLEGDKKGYLATELAREIKSMPSEEVRPKLQVAALTPAIFKALFDTFQGDTTPKSKIKYRLSNLNVHPESTGECADNYADTLEYAGLATVSGDEVNHIAASEQSSTRELHESKPAKIDREEAESLAQNAEMRKENDSPQANTALESSAKPGVMFNVNVSLDASLDSDKLAKQLELLRSYGVL